jgi:hypothetical protein
MQRRELTWDEQVQWVMRNTNVELENLYIVEEIAKPTTPTHIIETSVNDRTAIAYEYNNGNVG